jgi:hypothetical protein
MSKQIRTSEERQKMQSKISAVKVEVIEQVHPGKYGGEHDDGEIQRGHRRMQALAFYFMQYHEQYRENGGDKQPHSKISECKSVNDIGARRDVQNEGGYHKNGICRDRKGQRQPDPYLFYVSIHAHNDDLPDLIYI